jgi:sugar phosphate isomerase/epimerase
MLRTGLNPYGLTYTLGLQPDRSGRQNPDARGLDHFIEIASAIGAASIELHNGWLAPLDDEALGALAARLVSAELEPVLSTSLHHGTIDTALRAAPILGATVARVHLTPILCGDRAADGDDWPRRVATVRERLGGAAPRAAALGLTLAIENHQDFGSDELVDFCEEAGPSVGVCYDTGNSFPVAEAPLDFTRRIAPRVRHVHLKDYRAQFSDEGFRLVRCAIGEGAVPLVEIAAILAEHHASLSASLEPGALEARHVRLLTADWWRNYPARSAQRLAACLAAARLNRLPDDADWRTPYEQGASGETLIRYEREMIERSAATMRALGLMKGR